MGCLLGARISTAKVCIGGEGTEETHRRPPDFDGVDEPLLAPVTLEHPLVDVGLLAPDGGIGSIDPDVQHGVIHPLPNSSSARIIRDRAAPNSPWAARSAPDL